MTHSLEQLAKLTDSSISGDNNLKIDSVATLTDATVGQISFVSNPKYISELEKTDASAVILNKDLAEKYEGNALINDDPYLTFARVLQILHAEQKSKTTVHKSAVIDVSAKIHPSVEIGANVVIDEHVTVAAGTKIGVSCHIAKNSYIAKNVRVYPNVTIYKDTIIGENTIIHSGVVIGSDGFGFAPTKDKKWYKILQIGNVIIEDDVEIGANTTIDRATLGSTIICNGVKLDSQIHVGHNVKIEEHTVIAAATAIAGSTSIGKRCQIGGATAISGHLTIADDVIITGMSMVIKSITSPGVYSSGIAADENKKWRKNAARFRKLDEIAKNVSHLDKKLNGK